TLSGDPVHNLPVRLASRTLSHPVVTSARQEINAPVVSWCNQLRSEFRSMSTLRSPLIVRDTGDYRLRLDPQRIKWSLEKSDADARLRSSGKDHHLDRRDQIHKRMHGD